MDFSGNPDIGKCLREIYGPKMIRDTDRETLLLTAVAFPVNIYLLFYYIANVIVVRSQLLRKFRISFPASKQCHYMFPIGITKCSCIC